MRERERERENEGERKKERDSEREQGRESERDRERERGGERQMHAWCFVLKSSEWTDCAIYQMGQQEKALSDSL